MTLLLKRVRLYRRHYSACLICGSNSSTTNGGMTNNGASIASIPSVSQSHVRNEFANNNNILQQLLTPQDYVAVFIDSQNSSPAQFEVAQQHLNNSLPSHSITSIKRIYGEHSRLYNIWGESILRHGLKAPYHYPNKHLPKLHNIDVLMVMDIMETLYNNKPVKAYILITGDGDFTPLVHKLKEKGKIVMGYGHKKNSSKAFSSACHWFIDTQELIDAENKRVMDEKERKKEEGKALAKKLALEKRKEEKERADLEQKRFIEIPIRKVEPSPTMFTTFDSWSLFADLFTNPLNRRPLPKDPPITRTSNTEESTEKIETTDTEISPSLLNKNAREYILGEIAKREREAEGRWVQLDRLGSSIDSKKYGFKKLSKLFQDLKAEVEMKENGKRPFVRRTLSSTEERKEQSLSLLTVTAQKVILEQISKSEDKDMEGWVGIGVFGSSIDYKKFGYNKLSKLFQDIAEVETEKRGKKNSSMFVRIRPQLEE